MRNILYGIMAMRFSEIPELSKEVKKLAKKYKSILARRGDLDTFKKVVAQVPEGNTKHFIVLHRNDVFVVVKARFFCRYLRGNDKVRIVYAYYPQEDKIEFLEIYFKGNKGREDEERIQRYIRAR